MVNAQQWLDSEYPKERRSEKTELDISKGKVKKLFIHDSTLKGDLRLEGFTNLRVLNCSGHELVNLDLSECKNLRELDCSNNDLNSLNINSCSKLKKINCVSNDYLEEINISDCPRLTGPGFTRDTENNRLVKGSLIIKAKEDDIRNILVIGWAGNGKSTLANVLSGTNIFAESAGGVGKTVNFKKSNVFQWEGKKYCVIDNIGFGDNNVPNKADLLYRVGRGIYSAREGINQVLFVFSSRFSEEQIMAFNLFKDFISESGITRFTTLVRTNFPNFKESQECEEDKRNLLNQSDELRKIIDSCNDVIHVDNPSIPTIGKDDDDEEKEDKEQEIHINGRKRKKVREAVLNHLTENCSEIYKLKEWDSVYSVVANYMKQIEEKEKELENTSNDLLRNKLQGEIKAKKEKIIEEINVRITAEVGLLPKLAAQVEFKNVQLSQLFNSWK